jgi:hypothetical protein
MTSAAAIFTTSVSDHEIHVFYEIDGLSPSTGPGVMLAALGRGTGLGVPDDQKPALRERHDDKAIWKRASDLAAGEDFHEHVRRIVGGWREDLATFWTLDGTARRFVESAALYEEKTDPKERVKKRLALTFSKAAKDRLAGHAIRSDQVIVTIEAITLALFQTGHGFATAIVAFARPDGEHITALELLEAQIAIGRFNEVAWIDARTGRPVAGAPFTLGQFVRRLALGDTRKTTKAGRVTTYTYARFDQHAPTPERDAFARHLARHYTTDYVIAPDVKGVAFVGDFETVRHAVALEGAATIVGPTPAAPDLPKFLEGFKTVTFRRHYVPIALLAQHEHAFLVERTSASVISRTEMGEHAKTVERLLGLREASLTFRLCYRFSELSYITMHNTLNHAFREVLHLDTMLEKLASDVADVEVHLRSVKDAEDRRIEHQKHRRFYWASVTGGAALAGLTAFTVMKEIGELTLKLAGVSSTELAGWSGVALGTLVAAIAAIVGYRKGPALHEDKHGGHKTIHAMLDHMIERALK